MAFITNQLLRKKTPDNKDELSKETKDKKRNPAKKSLIEKP